MNELLKVYGHPRSGTNYFQKLLKRNFFWDQEVGVSGGLFGHWSDRKEMVPNDYGKLFGDHSPTPVPTSRAIYLYRDGRDVALSAWRSDDILNSRMQKMSFSDYLRSPIDWIGSPGTRNPRPSRSIVQHWFSHVSAWLDPPVLGNHMAIRYEDLLLEPELTIAEVAYSFGLASRSSFSPVKELVGISPNEGKIGRWGDHFSGSDLEYFFSVVPKDCPYLMATQSA